jgi:hypothetical protein
MQAAVFTQMDNSGRAAVVANVDQFFTAAAQCSNTEIGAMEQLMASTAAGLSLLTTLLADEADQYNPEMVKLLLQLKERGPVAKFKNAREVIERLYPSRG